MGTLRRRFGSVLRRGRTWYVRYRVNGLEVLKSLGPSRKLAEDFLADVQAKLAKEEGLGVRPIARASLSEVWRLVEASRRARLTPRGFQVQRDHVAAAAAFYGTLPVRDLRPRHLEDLLTSLGSRGRKGTTLNRYLTSLSSLLAEAVERGFAKQNIALQVKRHREELREVPFLGESEIRRLLAGASPGLRPIIAILGDTGLRRGELLSLQWADVDIARETVLVRRSKTGRGREVPLTSRARTAFEELRAARGAIPLRGDDLVFASLLELQRPPVRRKAQDSEFTPRRRAENRLSNQFSRLADGLGMDGLSLHALRHSCASRMVVAGVPLSFVARVTGHSTLRCAALYGRHAPADAGRIAIRALEAAAGATPSCDALPPAGAPNAPPSTPALQTSATVAVAPPPLGGVGHTARTMVASGA